MEIAFNEELRGNPGTLMISQDARRRWFGRIERQPDPGANVVLTIDEKIQYIAEKEIDQAMQRHAGQGRNHRGAEPEDGRNPGAGEPAHF